MNHSVLPHRRKYHRPLTPPPSGPVAIWHLEESSGDFADDTGNGNTLLRSGTINRIDGVYGYSQMRTNSPEGHFYIASGGDIDFTGDFSFAAWIWLGGGEMGVGYATIADKGLSDFRVDVIIDPETSSPAIAVYTTDWQVICIVQALATSAWFHLGVTKVTGSPPKVYFWAEEKTPHFSEPSGGSGSSESLKLMTFQGGYASGIDDVGIWGRAISASEMSDAAFNGLP